VARHQAALTENFDVKVDQTPIRHTSGTATAATLAKRADDANTKAKGQGKDAVTVSRIPATFEQGRARPAHHGQGSQHTLALAAKHAEGFPALAPRRPASVNARTEQQHDLERTGIHRGLERYCRQAGPHERPGILPRRLVGRVGASVVRRDGAINRMEDSDAKVCQKERA
jgi:hypothetical protein